MAELDPLLSEDIEHDWEQFTSEKANESNPFFPQDFSSYLSALKKYVKETGVTSLNMKQRGLKVAELKLVLELLGHSYSKVTSLNLEKNNFENGMQEELKLLTKTKIKDLFVSGSKLRKNDFMHLLEVLKDTKLIYLDVSCSNLKLDLYEASKLASHLLTSHLTWLAFEENQFDPATGALTLVHALPYTSITCLGLAECALHNDVLISLFSNIHRTKLTYLDVSQNAVTDCHIKELGPNLKASKLDELNLSCNKISDAGIDILAAGLVESSVTALDISCNEFRGRNSLGRFLKNTKIRELRLFGNDIKWCKMFSFPNFLKGSAIETLDMGDCTLGDKTGQKLMRSLKFSNLTKLTVNENKLGSLSLSEFAKNVNNTKLLDVDFSDNDFECPEFVLFSNCLKNSKLEYVDIANTLFLCSASEEVPRFLLDTKGTPVDFVDVSNNEIAKEGAEAVADILAMSGLTIYALNLSCNKIADGILKLSAHLKFSSLSFLNLADNEIKDSGAEALASVLKETQIVDLDISENLITCCGASAIALGLKGSNLLRLHLSRNMIDNAGLEALVENVKNTFITTLDLSYNPGNRIYLVEAVLLENRISEHNLVNFFKRIVPAYDEVSLCFDQVINNFNGGACFEELFCFCKTLEQPVALTALAEAEGIPFSRSKIVSLMEEFPRQFSVFVASKIKGSVSQHISILKRVEELELSKIVESLLLNRPMYMIDESQGILHPYMYKLLSKYKQPLYNLSIEPHIKKKIIDYFTNHAEYSDASDVVSLLLDE